MQLTLLPKLPNRVPTELAWLSCCIGNYGYAEARVKQQRSVRFWESIIPLPISDLPNRYWWQMGVASRPSQSYTRAIS